MNTQPATAPQQPQQHLQLSEKRHDFPGSIPPYCGCCVASEEKTKPEVEHEGAASGKSLRVPYITPNGDLVIPFDSDPKYHWWKPGGQSVACTRAEVLARVAEVERAGHSG
jgi:hypothetical protein